MGFYISVQLEGFCYWFFMGCHHLRVVPDVYLFPCLTFMIELTTSRSIRQYPLYDKQAPPDALKSHFDGDTFEKSQEYGRDKARFAFVSGIYRQLTTTAELYFDFYPWAWSTAGNMLSKLGYGGEVSVPAPKHYSYSSPSVDLTLHRLCRNSLCVVLYRIFAGRSI
jgi:hypothetical protein